mmetsp:Transcript_8033/g.26460  ORF Transcript_8033/g.26460 Transcript_8033/m.26460 type:complete len:99 (+) Transcript_8033:230-526(+)
MLTCRMPLPRSVVEVYASVWGPSEMVDAHLSAICYDLADTLSFAFVRAVSDNIPSLKEYAGASSSVFLFYMQGKVVAKVVGPKMSEIKAKIFELAPKL